MMNRTRMGKIAYFLAVLVLFCALPFHKTQAQSSGHTLKVHITHFEDLVKLQNGGKLDRLTLQYWKMNDKYAKKALTEITADLEDHTVAELDAKFGPHTEVQSDTQGNIRIENMAEGVYYFREKITAPKLTYMASFAVKVPGLATIGEGIETKPTPKPPGETETEPEPPETETEPPGETETEPPGETEKPKPSETEPDKPVEYGDKPFFKYTEENGTQKALAGAKFKVTRKVGTGYKDVLDASGKAYILESGSDGKFAVTHIPHGTYYLWETKAPKGFIQLNSPIKFEVSAESKDKVLTIKNKKKPPIAIPKTGDLATYLLLGAAVVLFAVGYKLTKEDKSTKKEIQ